MENIDSIQLLNTAIIKSKEKKIDAGYEKRLEELFKGPVIESLNKAINHLADTQKISRDQAAANIVETIRELDTVWSDYVMMEGITKLKEILVTQ